MVRIGLKMRLLERCGTQRRASDVLCIPEQRLSQIVRGRVEPTPREIEAMSLLFDSTPEELRDQVQRTTAPAY